MKSILRRILRRLVHAGRRPRAITHPERIHGLDLSTTDESACIAVWPESDQSLSGLWFGEGVCICKDVEIAAVGPGSIHIGDHASFQERCQIYGDIQIGAHCIFARNILVISTGHHFRDNPAWLISDQDRRFLAEMATRPERAGRRVVIEEDCWLGWGCAVMPGVYIGRGAVIGANCVVTRDVAPYEIHGGAPNSRISTRLTFAPPREISAFDDNSLPYFYRGFRQRRADLSRSLARGGIEATGTAVLVLAHEAQPKVRIRGKQLNPDERIELRIGINGQYCATHCVDAESFEISVEMPAATNRSFFVPPALQGSTYVEIQNMNGNSFLIAGADVSPQAKGSP